MKIPAPWDLEVGFMIQNPPFFLNYSTNIEYSLGREKVNGRKFHSFSSSIFFLASSLLYFLTFLLSISFWQSFNH